MPVSNPVCSHPCRLLISQTNPLTSSSDAPLKTAPCSSPHASGTENPLSAALLQPLLPCCAWDKNGCPGHYQPRVEGLCLIHHWFPRAKFRSSTLNSISLINACQMKTTVIIKQQSGYSCKPHVYLWCFCEGQMTTLLLRTFSWKWQLVIVTTWECIIIIYGIQQRRGQWKESGIIIKRLKKLKTS